MWLLKYIEARPDFLPHFSLGVAAPAVASLLYPSLLPRYKLAAEVEAYAVQLRYGGDVEQFATFIATRYGLDISIVAARALLNKKLSNVK